MGNLEVVGETHCPSDALRLVDQTSPDSVIVDPEFGGSGRHHLESRFLNAGLFRELKGSSDSLHLVAYTFHDTPFGVASILLAGADSYVYKGVKPENLEEAKVRFRSGERVLLLGPRTSNTGVVMGIISYMNRFTTRENQVLALLLRRHDDLWLISG